MLCILISIMFFKVAHLHLQQETEDGSLSKTYIESLKHAILNEIEKDRGTALMKKKEFAEGWCVEKKTNTTLSYPGCTDRIIEINYCWGQCNSLYIPGKIPLSSCSQCRAKTIKTKMYALDCLSAKKKKKVHYVAEEIILKCECLTCESEEREDRISFNDNKLQPSDEN